MSAQSQLSQSQLRASEVNGRALQLLARREHSRSELFNKLQKFCSDDSLLYTLLDDLEERGYLSDQRYCEAYITYRSNRGIGPVKIEQELVQKGVNKNLVMDSFDALDIDWLEIARRVWQKKYRGIEPSNASERAKQLRFMQYRGFDYYHVENCIELNWV